MPYDIDDVENVNVFVGNDDDDKGLHLGFDTDAYDRVHISPSGFIGVGDGTVPPSALSVGLSVSAPLGGSSPDDATIQSVLDAASPGQVVTLGPGTFNIRLRLHPLYTYYCGLRVPTGVTLRGSGRGVTILKLLPSQTPDVGAGDGAAIISNQILAGGDEDITIEDLTVDGNAANQTKTHNGIVMIRTRNVYHNRVAVRYVRGTSNAPPNETFHFETQLGTDTHYTDCLAHGGSGSTATGFSADNHTGAFYVNCVSRNMTSGHGYTHYQCQEISYSSCRAYDCGDNGFNSEESQDATWSSCLSGGEVATGSSPYPLSAGTSLGSTGSGYVVNGTRNAILTSCAARKNGTGITIVEGTQGSSGAITGCAFTHNTYGVSCATTAPLARFNMADNRVADNVTAQYTLSTGNTNGPGGELTGQPAVPSAGVATVNVWPFPVTVYLVTQGTLTLLRINDADINTTTNVIHLDPGMNIKWFGSVAPTWKWFAT